MIRSKAVKKNLVIVESPAKAHTLEKFLGKEFEVKACNGHIRDLPKNNIGVDVENGFVPKYVNIKGKIKIINSLTKLAKNAEVVYLAPDPDREGEAIAWHLNSILKAEGKTKRIEFNEITKNAVVEAIKHPREINMDRVDAQQARRILDRLVGYKISPILWKKVRRGLSAGRVQSITVRLICEREDEIRKFIPQEYWTIEGLFAKERDKLSAKYLTKTPIDKEINAQKIVDDCKGQNFSVIDIKKKEQRRNPAPTFITSTLQQDAARKLGFSPQRTMAIAQQLYEGIELKGEGSVGLITYMRTDSVRIADEALTAVREYIKKVIGSEYLPETPRFYKTKKSAQDAHEGIRPTYVTKNPDSIKDDLTVDQYKLYSLIWKRFVACQMESAVVDQTSIDIKGGEHTFRATGSVIKFPGFIKIYTESKEDHEEKAEEDEKKILPLLNIGDNLTLEEIEKSQHFTEPPPRFNEASLIKELESRGIGRPSTYAPTLHTIEARGYVQREGKVFHPTELGEMTNKLLVKFFPTVLDYEFTAKMEDDLDDILDGKIKYATILKEFYGPFEADVANANENMEVVKKEIIIDELCPNCGKNLAIKSGRFGDFKACTGFPECKYTKAIIQSIGLKCFEEGCDGELTIRKSRFGKIFYSCSNYPTCKAAFWDKPTGELCPKCKKPLVEKVLKNKNYIKCSSKECDYSTKDL